MDNPEGERQIPYDITYMWHLKYDTNEPIYETETDSQTQRTDLWVLRQGGMWAGEEGLGVWDEQMQIIIYRMDTNKVLLYSTGNYIQYPVINHNGKEYEKECIHTYN